MSRVLDFTRDGRDWPHREASRFVTAGGVRFHVQIVGDDGPAVLMLHGTGASTHSFRDLVPPLARDHRLIMIDLPGHGFSGPLRGRPTMDAMSRAIGALLPAIDGAPLEAVGHSAGAALLVRMALDGRISPRRIVSLNGALLPFPGLAAQLFPQLAKLLFLNPIAPRLFSWRARNGPAVRQLMDATGSRISAQGVAYYETLLAASSHVDGALKMMANWDLEALRRDLPRLGTPMTLVVGTNDKAIPPSVSHRVAKIVKSAELVALEGLGHLAHEEAPERTATAIRTAFEKGRRASGA